MQKKTKKIKHFFVTKVFPVCFNLQNVCLKKKKTKNHFLSIYCNDLIYYYDQNVYQLKYRVYEKYDFLGPDFSPL